MCIRTRVLLPLMWIPMIYLTKQTVFTKKDHDVNIFKTKKGKELPRGKHSIHSMAVCISGSVGVRTELGVKGKCQFRTIMFEMTKISLGWCSSFEILSSLRMPSKKVKSTRVRSWVKATSRQVSFTSAGKK